MERLEKIFNIIEKSDGECYIVGGVVRDYVIEDIKSPRQYLNIFDYIEKNIDILDIDLTTNLTPEQVQEAFKGYTAKKTMATVIVVVRGLKVEITTFRKDVKCYGRKAEFEYATTIEEDCQRRDFTMNALYCDSKGNVIDPFKGIEDIKNNVVRFIGNAEVRIKEDYLRIMRYLRFLARIKCMSDEKTVKIIKDNIEGLKDMSIERKMQEIYKMLSYSYLQEVLNLIQSEGLEEEILLAKIDNIYNKNLQDEYKNTASDFIKYIAIIGYENIPEQWIVTKKEKSYLRFIEGFYKNHIVDGEFYSNIEGKKFIARAIIDKKDEQLLQLMYYQFLRDDIKIEAIDEYKKLKEVVDFSIKINPKDFQYKEDIKEYLEKKKDEYIESIL